MPGDGELETIMMDPDIFQNCNTRYITPSAKMMHHQIQVYNLKGDLKKVSRYLSQIEKYISNSIYQNRLIFDGYPRNIPQAENLEAILKKHNQSISAVLFLKLSSFLKKWLSFFNIF